MKRRDFLKLAAAAPVAFAVPAVARAPEVPGAMQLMNSIVFRNRIWQDAAPDYYTAFVHPDCWVDIRRFVAKDLWAIEYRAWRKQRNTLGEPEPLRDLMLRVKAEAAGHLRGRREFQEHGEVGSFGGVRFVTAERVS